MALDSSRNVIVTGATYSTDFPVVFPSQRSIAGGRDGFITKLNYNGNGLVFSTYFGGAGADLSNAVAVDSTGNIYVGGDTKSSNLPVLSAVDNNEPGCRTASWLSTARPEPACIPPILAVPETSMSAESRWTRQGLCTSQAAPHPSISPLPRRCSRRTPVDKTLSPRSSRHPGVRSFSALI